MQQIAYCTETGKQAGYLLAQRVDETIIGLASGCADEVVEAIDAQYASVVACSAQVLDVRLMHMWDGVTPRGVRVRAPVLGIEWTNSISRITARPVAPAAPVVVIVAKRTGSAVGRPDSINGEQPCRSCTVRRQFRYCGRRCREVDDGRGFSARCCRRRGRRRTV